MKNSIKTEKQGPVSIPIIIGVTGHRNLKADEIPAITNAVTSILSEFSEKYPNSEIHLISNMAIGADEICAKAALSLGMKLIAALPFDQKEYETNYSAHDLNTFRSLLKQSMLVFPVHKEISSKDSRDLYYLDAGKYIVDSCHVLIVLSDGSTPKTNGCGTIEIADYAKRLNKPIIHISCSREKTVSNAGNVSRIGDFSDLKKNLNKTDTFNKRIKSLNSDCNCTLLEKNCNDPYIKKLECLYSVTDQISVSLADKYKKVLASLALAGSFCTFVFLLYDKLNFSFLIFLCGLIILYSYQRVGQASKKGWHRDYLEYRTLSELLRTQTYLRYAGSNKRVYVLSPWSQHYETEWTLTAVNGLLIGSSPIPAHNVKECWIEDQRNYHLRSIDKCKNKAKQRSLVLKISLIISVASYVVAIFKELSTLFNLTTAFPDSYKMVINLCLGTFSAITLFINSYFGQLSVKRQKQDGEKMAQFYDSILKKWDDTKDNSYLIEQTAREELIENGNWFSYKLDNSPEIKI